MGCLEQCQGTSGSTCWADHRRRGRAILSWELAVRAIEDPLLCNTFMSERIQGTAVHVLPVGEAAYRIPRYSRFPEAALTTP